MLLSQLIQDREIHGTQAQKSAALAGGDLLRNCDLSVYVRACVYVVYIYARRYIRKKLAIVLFLKTGNKIISYLQ